MEEAAQGARVPGDTVVRVMPLKLPTQVDVLRGYRLVPVLAAPVSDLAERSTKAAGRCLALDHGLPLAGRSPEPGESQQVEASDRRPGGPFGSAGSAEVHHPGLYRMQRQAIPCKPLAQYLHDPACVLLRGEHDDRVVRIADHEALRPQAWHHSRREPRVQDFVQVDVRQQWRHDALNAKGNYVFDRVVQYRQEGKK